MPESNQNSEERRAERRSAGAAIGFGTSFAAGMAIFGLGGHWLDEKYDREPLFTLLGLFLGLLYGGWELWKLTSASNRPVLSDHKKSENDGGTPHDPRQS